MSTVIDQVMVTIVAPLNPDNLTRAQSAIDQLGNPPRPEIRAALDATNGERGIHFMSLHALQSCSLNRAYIIFEFSADDDAARAIRQIADAITPELTSVLRLASDWRDGDDIATYLTKHQIKIGVGIGANPGLAFAGTPGLSVGQIKEDADLASKIADLLAAQPAAMSGLERIAAVRASFAPGASCLQPTDPLMPFVPAPLSKVIITAIGSLARTYLWPFALLLGVGAVVHGIHVAYFNDGPPIGSEHHAHLADMLRQTVIGRSTLAAGSTAFALVCGAVLLAMASVAAGIMMYLRLRSLEASDWISSRMPDRAMLQEIVARENVYVHNHMMSLTQRKPGWLRYFLLRLMFWVIGLLARLRYVPGHLGTIGTIHFARWITVPGTRDLIFLSNYGGSWESYLEDFITLAHDGLTGIWSNAVGFPKTTNLIADGATDGERFKRFARQSMQPTRFWYSAYPTLTTENIRRNAMIRRGLSAAMTEDDATAWLAFFGSAPRPADKLVSSEIQSLLFGGLGFLPHGSCTLWALPDDVAHARAWLRDVMPDIAFNDGRRFRTDDRRQAVVQLAVSSAGLAKLGMPQDGLSTFPAAFLDDMTGLGRARIIGDVGANAPENWWWGQSPSDVALLIYGQEPEDVAALAGRLDLLAATHGSICSHRIRLEPTVQMSRKPDCYANPDPPDRRYFGSEPFGFADGISQPVIRGTYKGQKDADPLHVVEPGEFILGYPDNRGNLPPRPSLNALHDPGNLLPIMDSDCSFATASVNNRRDLGFNGSFIVIRQLEQDVDGFNHYCATEAENVRTRFSTPYNVTPEFIGAKMVGRWKNGSALVRAPYSPSHDAHIITENSFLLGVEDPEGMRCPFGAHVRRTNPRDSLMPGSDAQVEITNRHRILRVGRKYAVHPGQKPGLLFMCLNGDLERQFEFIQQTWAMSSNFRALSGEQDPLLGNGTAGHNGFSIPSRDGTVKLSPIAQFVTMRGGGYFFLPGKRLIAYLSEVPRAG
jgi:deferrochelatase/peroxidase EfeB